MISACEFIARSARQRLKPDGFPLRARGQSRAINFSVDYFQNVANVQTLDFIANDADS